MRTSQTHPLRIDEVAVGPGRIGMTLCPGKKGESVFGLPWDRDLQIDLEAIRDWGAETVLTLVEAQEIEALSVIGLGEAVGRHGIDWKHLPIPDLGVPSDAVMENWRRLSPGLHQVLDRGGRVLIHCRGGLGRAGTMAALLLIERGEGVKTAIDMVRKARPGAIETKVQQKFLQDVGGERSSRANLIRASLFGGAIGDALGAEIEFWSLERIQKKFPRGVDAMLAHAGRVGTITDDTQMTLFTAEGLLRARTRGTLKGIVSVPTMVHFALLRWYVTQGGRSSVELDNHGLVSDPRLQVRRAPGNTCMSALSDIRSLGRSARNNSKGCGTIMRVAPLALISTNGLNLRDMAIETSALTHGHRTAQEAAAAWAMLLNLVLDGETAKEAARALLGQFNGETGQAIRGALEAPKDGTPETVETLGSGWVAEEALSIALYAVLNSTSFEDGLRIAVTHSGDSDSTGAIAGNLLGLIYPDNVMSHRWRREVECADLIDRLAVDLAKCRLDDAMIDKYPGW